MADENVVQLPTLLDRLAERIRNYLGRDAANHDEWMEIQEGICLTLAEARAKFLDDDVGFGQWCKDNGFGEDTLDRNKRAAAIAMGGDPDALSECLKTTTRRSLTYIYKHDFGEGFHYVMKPSGRRKNKKDSSHSPQMRKALDAYDELEAKGEPITAKAIQERAGVSDTPVRRVFALKSEEAKLDPLTPGEMRQTQRKRYELALKKARGEIREALKAEVYRELDVYVLHWKEKSERADRILAHHNGIMSRDDFRKIRACLHPDHNSFTNAAEAFRIFAALEELLVKPDDPVFSGPPLPTTAAELMARRRR